MRKFVFVVVLGVLAWIFVVPSCSTKFGCEAAGYVAHADSGSCPSSLDEAAQDRAWADARIAGLPQPDKGDRTNGLLYESDGEPIELESGESGDEYEAAEGFLRGRAGGQQAAGHVEAKGAARLRNDDEVFGVLVINAEPCAYALRVGCVRVAALILASGSRLVIWSPKSRFEVQGSA